MILALFGTLNYPFPRLMDALVQLAPTVNEPIFVQAGHTPFGADLDCVRFLTPGELREKINSASLVITQGGFGSMSDVLGAGKPLVAVPRERERDEENGNQSDLVRVLDEMGVLVPVYHINDLPQCVHTAREREHVPAPQSEIPKQLAATVGAWLK